MTTAELTALEAAYPDLALVFALASEALARREGATALQAIVARLHREGCGVCIVTRNGKFWAYLLGVGRWCESRECHETEVAAVLAAVAERDRHG